MAEAEACGSDMEGRGVGDAERIWLSILITTKRIFIAPTVNALGYNRKSHIEDVIDLNQYFITI